MKYTYTAIEVDVKTQKEVELGDVFCGGVVIDGVNDYDNDVPLLIIRSTEPLLLDDGEWEAAYRQLHGLVKTVRITSVVPPEVLLNQLGNRDEMVKGVVMDGSIQLIQALVNVGGVGWVETPISAGPDDGGTFVQTFVLAVPDFEVFNKLPRPKPIILEVEADGEEQPNEG